MIPSFLATTIALNLFLVIFLAILSFSDIRNQFSKVSRTTWILLVLIFLLALSLRILTPHHHFMYIDEPLNMEVAKNMLLKGRAEFCEYIDFEKEICQVHLKMVGVPFVFTVAFLLFGINNYVAIYASVLFGSLSVILIFSLVYLLFKKEGTGLFSALIFSIMPFYVMWSGTAETYTLSIFFSLLALTGFMIYFKAHTQKTLLFAIASLTFAIQTRIEASLLLPLVAVMFLFSDKELTESIRKRSFWFSLAAFAPFMVSYVLQFKSYSDLVLMSHRSYEVISYSLFGENMISYISDLLSGMYYPFIFNLVAFFGLVFLLKSKEQKEPIFLITFFLIFSLVSNFITSSRHIVMFAVLPILILISYGFFEIPQKLKKSGLRLSFYSFLVIFILISVYYHPYAKAGYRYHSTNMNVLETRIPELMESEIPSDCYVITQFPIILSATTDIKAIRIEHAIKNPEVVLNVHKKTACIVLLEDMFYFVSGFGKYFNIMHDRYDLIPYTIYEADNGLFNYTVYNVSI